MLGSVINVNQAGHLHRGVAIAAHHWGAAQRQCCRLAAVWALTLLACSFSVMAQDTPQPDARAWLAEAQHAARQVDYDGVFTWQQGSSLQSSRIVHIVDGTGERERIEVLDGVAREFIRHNEVVQCLVPEKNLVLIEDHQIHRFPGVMPAQDTDLSAYYDLTLGSAVQRVAGRTCLPLEIRPKDDARYGHRLCIDEQSQLLLKSQTLDAQGRVIDQIAFTHVRVGKGVQAEQLRASWDTDDWKVVQTAGDPIDITEQGWRITPPSGFRYLTQMLRPMRHHPPVIHLVMTDGLAAISVFIEPVSPRVGERPVGERKQTGAMGMYGSRIGDHWLTVVGEVPLATLRHIAEQAEYVPPVNASK